MKTSWIALSLPLWALGCGSTVSVGSGGSGGGDDCGAPPAGDCGWVCADGKWASSEPACGGLCPLGEPEESSPCTFEGLSCEYLREDIGDCESSSYEVTYFCNDGLWSQISNRCSPPIECPAELPIDGSDCTGWDYAWDCFYQVASDCAVGASAYAQCDTSTYSWVVALEGEPCPSCVYADAGSCSADPACRWLVPGCGDALPVVEGCYAAEPCTEQSCDAGSACVTVDVDPCWATLCNACSATTDVCQPVPEPL